MKFLNNAVECILQFRYRNVSLACQAFPWRLEGAERAFWKKGGPRHLQPSGVTELQLFSLKGHSMLSWCVPQSLTAKTDYLYAKKQWKHLMVCLLLNAIYPFSKWSMMNTDGFFKRPYYIWIVTASSAQGPKSKNISKSSKWKANCLNIQKTTY